LQSSELPKNDKFSFELPAEEQKVSSNPTQFDFGISEDFGSGNDFPLSNNNTDFDFLGQSQQ